MTKTEEWLTSIFGKDDFFDPSWRDTLKSAAVNVEVLCNQWGLTLEEITIYGWEGDISFNMRRWQRWGGVLRTKYGTEITWYIVPLIYPRARILKVLRG